MFQTCLARGSLKIHFEALPNVVNLVQDKGLADAAQAAAGHEEG